MTTRASTVSDVPDPLARRNAAIVGTDLRQKWLVFECPCNRGHRVMLNLDRENRPFWRVANEYPLTLHPSVYERSTVGHCHYILRDGCVRWIERTDRA